MFINGKGNLRVTHRIAILPVIMGDTVLIIAYRHAVNYRTEVEPVFTSTPTSLFVTLYNLNYNVPIGKVLIEPEKVAIEDENVLIASENLLFEVAIDGLTANKNTKENAKKLFARMNFDSVFGRNDIMGVLNISITAAGNLINRLKEAGLMEKQQHQAVPRLGVLFFLYSGLQPLLSGGTNRSQKL